MNLLNDLRVTLRTLARSPGFTATAVLTLTLGLAGTIAMFAVLERVVLDPLPYPESDRLVRLTNAVPGSGTDAEWNLSTAQYFHYRERVSALEEVGLFVRYGSILARSDGAQPADVVRTTAGTLGLLGAGASVGRVLTGSDDTPDAPPVVVLSHEFWVQQFGGDAGVVGTTVDLGGSPFEIVGVMAEGVDLPPPPGGVPVPTPDFWMPLRLDPTGPFYNSHVYPAVGRLAPGATLDDLRGQLQAAVAELPEAYPSAYSQEFFDEYGFRPLASGLKEHVVGDVAGQLWILLAGVGLVLAIAWADVANLLLARGEKRRREMAIRTALGGGPKAVVRQFLTEGAVLAVAGGGFGLVLGLWTANRVADSGYGGLPRLASAPADGSLLLFATGLSTVVALALAMVPLIRLRVGRVDPGRESLAGAERGGASLRESRIRAWLIVGQAALAMILVVGSGLLLQSFRNLQAEDPGIDAEGVLTFQAGLPGDRSATPADRWRFYDRLFAELRALPGVSEAGVTRAFPFSNAFGCTVQAFEDPAVTARLGEADMTTCAAQQPTSAGYFEAMGIRALQGRTFRPSDHDEPGAGPVVVSREFAERFWPGEDPMGRGVAPSGRSEGPFFHVVGVVDDVYATSVQEDPAPVIYYPIVPMSEALSSGWSAGAIAVRTELDDPSSLFPAIRSVVAEMDPAVVLANPEEMSVVVARSMGRVTLSMTLLLVAAVAALALAGVGLFGTLSYLVSRRTGEIGVRRALGASGSRIQRDLTGGLLGLVALGAGIGIVVALQVTGVLTSLLHEVEPTEPAVYLVATGALALVAAAAGSLPARRASRIPPREALRVE